MKRLELSSGTLEGLKWLAVVLMTVDHVNTYLLSGQVIAMYDIGRMAFPIFGFVFAYNVARAGFFDHVWRRLAKLAAVGGAAQLFIVMMGGEPGHLNIMFTFAVVVLGIYACNGLPKVLAVAVLMLTLLLPGLFVDYGAPGLLYVLTAYNLVRRPTALNWGVFTAALGLLYGLNGNFFALCTLPLFFGAGKVDLAIKRAKYAFYLYYPMHLGVLALISSAIGGRS